MERENNWKTDQGRKTPLLGGSADSTADRPKAGSSVSITLSLQIIYISPSAPFAAHMLIKLAFPRSLWLEEREKHPETCTVGGRNRAQ